MDEQQNSTGGKSAAQSDKDEVIEFIKRYSLATLATISPDGAPHASSVYVVPDEDLNLYFVTRSNTTKYRNIKAHPEIALAFTREDEYQTIQVRGRSEDVLDTDVRRFVLNLLLELTIKDQKTKPPVHQLDGDDYVFIKITPTSLRWGDFRNHHWGENIYKDII